jgi:hypothetical protein
MGASPVKAGRIDEVHEISGNQYVAYCVPVWSGRPGPLTMGADLRDYDGGGVAGCPGGVVG